MGETRKTKRLSDATGRRAVGGLAARFNLTSFFADEQGATAIEYGLMASLISLALFTIFGNAAKVIVDTINTAMAKVQ